MVFLIAENQNVTFVRHEIAVPRVSFFPPWKKKKSVFFGKNKMWSVACTIGKALCPAMGYFFPPLIDVCVCFFFKRPFLGKKNWPCYGVKSLFDKCVTIWRHTRFFLFFLVFVVFLIKSPYMMMFFWRFFLGKISRNIPKKKRDP